MSLIHPEVFNAQYRTDLFFVKDAISASAVKAAEPMAKPLPVAAVVFPRGVKRVRALANRFVKSRHLSNTARVVRNGTVSVGGKRYAES